MSGVWITRIAAVTGLAPDLDRTWQRLLGGESAIRPVSLFPAGRYLAGNGAWVDGLTPREGESRLFPLLDALLGGFGPVPADCRFLTATTKGCVDSMERIRKGLPADPAPIAVPQLTAGLAARLGIADPGVNLNGACASSTLAVARAAGLIAAGMADAVLVLCMDILSEFVFSGFSALQALSPDGCRPFDRSRNGLSLGEGAAALLLMGSARARREKLPCLAVVAGWGAANDATHVTAPARDGCGLVQAVGAALSRAGLAGEQVGGISAHGTGTVYNDLMELTAFRTVFGDRRLPVHSVKGAIGHTLGAAGGIEIAIGVKSLRERVVPPTVGLLDPEELGEGWLSGGSQQLDGRYLLSTNSGFGGVIAAVILEEGETP
jgi:3-oxoacyl-[acyl-carrier-protein] synthase II